MGSGTHAPGLYLISGDSSRWVTNPEVDVLSPDDRSRILGFGPMLSPGSDVSVAVSFLVEHRDDCVAECGAVPGHDAVRTILLRLLPPSGLAEDVRQAALAGARQALEAFVGRDATAVSVLRRHPSWVVLAAREWAEQTADDDADAVVAGVVDEAKAALVQLSPGEPAGDGEVLWAVAETADEVGWSDHAVPLLAAAADASFDEEHNRGRVRLVRILGRIEAGDTEVGEALHELLSGDLDDQTRVHAHWLAALSAHERGADAEAVLQLDAALDLVDEGEAPEVVARLRDTHRAWSGGAAGPAEA